jgi:hypothetical protein
MNLIPKELDWVTERAKCSPESVLQLLEIQAKTDVETRIQLRNATELQYGVEFSFREGSGAFQIVVHRMGEIMGSAIFERFPDGIRVTYKDHSSFAGVLTLGNDGQCRLRVGDSEELEFWQFRKKALEPIFFDLLQGLRQ